MSGAYYNEIDPEKAAWLRALILTDHIAPGDVDERSIWDVRPDDLRGYTQCHWFAGIGVWSYALRRAGWADDRPVWTGSCPCQPFSEAGAAAGFADERHAWPAWHWHISQRRPDVVLGEQVANGAGPTWLDLVSADMEGAGYAFGAFDLCAAGVGAPHRRQRLYFAGALVDAAGEQVGFPRQPRLARSALADHGVPRLEVVGEQPARQERATAERGGEAGHWTGHDWVDCRDGKRRPVEPGTFPVADGAPARMVRLRGYGDAIVAPLAQAFIEEVMGVLPWAA